MGRRIRTTTARTPKRGRRTPVRVGVLFATDAAATITIDDAPEAGEVTRADVTGRVAAIILELGRPALVRVREIDGSVFADVLTPPSRDPAVLVDSIRSDLARRPVGAPPQLLEITGSGFVPGEDVEVAPVLQTVTGGNDGTARALLDTSELGTSGQVLLFGAASGTTILSRHP